MKYNDVRYKWDTWFATERMTWNRRSQNYVWQFITKLWTVIQRKQSADQLINQPNTLTENWHIFWQIWASLCRQMASSEKHILNISAHCYHDQWDAKIQTIRPQCTPACILRLRAVQMWLGVFRPHTFRTISRRSSADLSLNSYSEIVESNVKWL